MSRSVLPHISNLFVQKATKKYMPLIFWIYDKPNFVIKDSTDVLVALLEYILPLVDYVTFTNSLKLKYIVKKIRHFSDGNYRNHHEAVSKSTYIIFQFSHTLTIIPHELLLHKLNHFIVYVFDMSSPPFLVFSGVHLGPVLGSLHFNMLIIDLYEKINPSNSFRFGGVFKILELLWSSSKCLLLGSDIDCDHGWCSTNFVEFEFNKSRVISFTQKIIMRNYHYFFDNLYWQVITLLGKHTKYSLY
jgi:hypothetical protein